MEKKPQISLVTEPIARVHQRVGLGAIATGPDQKSARNPAPTHHGLRFIPVHRLLVGVKNRGKKEKKEP